LSPRSDGRRRAQAPPPRARHRRSRARRRGRGSARGDATTSPVRPTLVQYDVPGWGVGELWLDGKRVLASSHPVPGRTSQVTPCYLADRLRAWFAGEPDDFLDVELDL